MSGSGHIIDFDILENQKENIQSLPQGRSAKALASAFTPGGTRNLNDALRAEYEAELQTIDDSDDPLDVYDRYVRWTFNAYPTTQATPESQLRPLLERATKAFQNTPTYKNDPRYLKLWIHYIRLFSDAPREIFAYLSRHEIGEGLALYYEEFAAWLEGAGRWNQAEEIYKLGIEREARPSERLLRKFGEFQRRYENRSTNTDEPSSPALPAVRPALAAKIDPYASGTTAGSDDPQAQRLPSTAASARGGRQKMTIFADADGSLAGKLEAGDVSKGWDNIGSIKDRKKENTIEARPWAGETLKTGQKTAKAPKMAIFRDQSTPESNTDLSNARVPAKSALVSLQETTNPKTGKLERIKASLMSLYPNANDEFCFAEVMSQHRGWALKNWTKERQPVSRAVSVEIDTRLSATSLSSDVGDSTRATTAIDGPSPDQTLSDITKEISKDDNSGKSRRKKVMEVKSETQTVKLNLSSPTKTKKVRRKSTVEPTMTLHSRAATDEVLDMFNQTLRDVGSITEEPNDFNDSDYDEDDYTSGGESNYTETGRLSVAGSEYEDRTEAIDDVIQPADEISATENNLTRTTNDLTTAEPDITNNWTGASVATGQPALAEIDTTVAKFEEDVKTPDLPTKDDAPHFGFMQSPPEGMRVPTHPFRDPEQINQNRLPFMTPIVEMTESSMSLPSTRRDHTTFKTPSRRRYDGEATIPELEDLILEEDVTGTHQLLVVEDAKTEQVLLVDLRDHSENKDETMDKQPNPVDETPEISRVEEAKVNTDLDESAPVDTSSNIEAYDINAPLIELDISDENTKAKELPQENRATTAAIGKSTRDVIIFDDHVNPVDEEVRQKILKTLSPPLSSYSGFYDHRPAQSLIKSDLDKLFKSGSKKGKTTGEKIGTTEGEIIFRPLENEIITVKQLIGRGGWASVFLVEAQSTDGEQHLQAMKSEFEPSAWEFAIMVLAHARLQHWSQLEFVRTTTSIAKPLAFHFYKDAAYMSESFYDKGNLLELVNRIKADALPAGSASGASIPGIEEHLAMFFAIEILRTVSDLHSVGLLHCDLKADNFLVRLSPIDEAEQEWNPAYSPSGESGWLEKGIVLIDYGRAIDTLAFKPDTSFYAEWATDKHDCPEQREARPWTYQADLWGIASIFSVLLFGKVLEEMIVTEPNAAQDTASLPLNSNSSTNSRRYRPREVPKRYWQTEIWNDAFDVLMNPVHHATQSEKVGRGSGGIKGLPAAKLKTVRERMEHFLVENGEKKGLKQGLKKLEEKLASSGLARKK